MKYKGNELQEFTTDKPIVFDPPKKMFVCDTAELLSDCNIDYVYAYIPAAEYPVKTSRNCFSRCAEIPEDMKPRRATNRELAKWLAHGNGECKDARVGKVWLTYEYYANEEYDECSSYIKIRNWDDEWHEPTVDYMGL